MKQNSLPAYLAGAREIKGANRNGGITLERARVLPSCALLITRVIFLSLAILRWRDGGGVGSNLCGASK